MKARMKALRIPVGLALAALLIWGLWTYLDASRKIYSDDDPQSFSIIQVFDENRFVFVGVKKYTGRIYYGQNYVTTVAQHTRYTGKMTSPVPIGEEEYYRVISYNLNSSDPLKEKTEFDLYQLLKDPSPYRSALTGLESYYLNGTDYFVMPMQLLHSYDLFPDGPNDRQLLFTPTGEILREGTAEKIRELEDAESNANPYKPNISWGRGGVSDQLRATLSKYYLREGSGATLIGDGENEDKIDLSGTNFARIYPEIAQHIKEIDCLYFRPEQYNEREWFDRLIHWFAPEGQDVIEIYATDEETGERTQIRSYDEFAAWVEAHPKKEESNE